LEAVDEVAFVGLAGVEIYELLEGGAAGVELGGGANDDVGRSAEERVFGTGDCVDGVPGVAALGLEDREAGKESAGDLLGGPYPGDEGAAGQGLEVGPAVAFLVLGGGVAGEVGFGVDLVVAEDGGVPGGGLGEEPSGLGFVSLDNVAEDAELFGGEADEQRATQALAAAAGGLRDLLHLLRAITHAGEGLGDGEALALDEVDEDGVLGDPVPGGEAEEVPDATAVVALALEALPDLGDSVAEAADEAGEPPLDVLGALLLDLVVEVEAGLLEGVELLADALGVGIGGDGEALLGVPDALVEVLGATVEGLEGVPVLADVVLDLLGQFDVADAELAVFDEGLQGPRQVVV